MLTLTFVDLNTSGVTFFHISLPKDVHFIENSWETLSWSPLIFLSLSLSIQYPTLGFTSAPHHTEVPGPKDY